MKLSEQIIVILISEGVREPRDISNLTHHLSGVTSHFFQVEIVLKPEESLGLVVRGGDEHGVGIFVLHVDPGSLAHRMGLKVILSCSVRYQPE